MSNFILAGEHCDGVAEAILANQSGQHQLDQAEELADQSGSGEEQVSLTLVQREYSYKCLKSWWQNMERQINQCSSDDRRNDDGRHSTANQESTPKSGGSKPQENLLEVPMVLMQDGVQAAEAELEESAHSGRRSMQATPEALFLAEKLQQLADTTREMAQHLLSPEAAKSRRGSTPGSEAPDLENSRDLELMRQKILLLDDVVEELSQYRLAPLALDVTERSMGETSESECLWNDSAVSSNSANVENTNGDGADFQQGLDTSDSNTFPTEDTQNTVPSATEEHGSEDAEVSETSEDDDRPLQHFAAEVSDDPRTSPVQLSQRDTQTGSPGSHLDSSISSFSAQQHRLSMGHWKETTGTAQLIRQSVSKRDRLDRVTTTALRLLSYPIIRHALHEAVTNTTGEDTFVGQKMPLRVVQRDVAPSGTELHQPEAEINSYSSHLDTSASDLLQEKGVGICHGNKRHCKTGHTAYEGQQRASKPGGIDGMIALVQRLLRLQIMGHA